MKKILAILVVLLSVACNATEKFSEFYVMEKVFPLLMKTQSYSIDNKEVKVVRVDEKVLKALGTTNNPFYYNNSNNELKMVRIGDYMVAPVTFSKIDSVDSNYFRKNFIKK